MNYYQKRKSAAREMAIDWQNHCGDSPNLSYAELSAVGDMFYKLGKRYGLLREFHENCIPC